MMSLECRYSPVYSSSFVLLVHTRVLLRYASGVLGVLCNIFSIKGYRREDLRRRGENTTEQFAASLGGLLGYDGIHMYRNNVPCTDVVRKFIQCPFSSATTPTKQESFLPTRINTHFASSSFDPLVACFVHDEMT